MSQPQEAATPELSPLQKAALAIKELRARLDAAEAARSEPVALVGMACRFPGASDCDTFWRLLEEGRDAIAEVPAARWDLAHYFDANPNAPGKINTRYGGFIDRVDSFDAAFFGISAQEAERMDPQQRLLLQTAWHALEDAGLPPASLRGTRCGVFVGITQNDYGMQQMAGPESDIQAYTGTGNGFCFAAGRLAYALGTQGPAFAVDTACSSSLVALHQACQALRNGECELALVAGVQLNLAPQMQIFLARTQSFSPDGRCRSFDAAANGFVLGEGIGVVVLRRLADAQARREPIRALVRGSAVNHGGAASGLTVPNEAAQESVVRDALAQARLAPDDIDFIEAHGSATELGDPIEVGALRAVFGARPADRPLLLGAVKSNCGHLSAAAGIAGLIKTVLMLEHERIAPNLHFRTPSPRIDWDGFPVRVPSAVEAWPRGEQGDRVRRAGVSSFGLSGTNAHVVVEEAPLTVPAAATVPERPLHLLALSARSPAALRVLAQAYAALPDDINLADLCYSANSGRSHFACRLVVRAADRAELQRGLEDFLAASQASTVAKGGPGRLVWVFPDAVDVDAQLARAALWRGWGLEPDAVAGSGNGAEAAHRFAGADAQIPVHDAHDDLSAYAQRLDLDHDIADWPSLLDTLTALYLRGCNIDWAGFDAGHPRRRVRLPGYPFEEKRYWLDKVDMDRVPAPQQSAAPELIGLLERQQRIVDTALGKVAELQTAFLKRRAAAEGVAPASTIGMALPERLGDWRLLGLAADDAAGLDTLSVRLAGEASEPIGLHGVGPQRRVLVHRGRDDALAGLANPKRVLNAMATAGRSLVFMFPGVGDHYLRMAAGLYASAPAFRTEVDACCDFLRPLLGVDLREVIWPAVAEKPPAAAGGMPDLRAMLGRGAATVDPAEARLNQTLHCQPGVFVVEYALGRLWQSYGIEPDALIGYSIGEYAAACLAGVIEVEDALRLIARRAQMIETLPPGVLLAVPLSEGRLRPLLGTDLSIALISTPTMCVVGGTEAAVQALEARLKGEEVVSRRLPGTHAFHSHLLAPLHEQLVELVSSFRLRPPRIPYVSNLTGTWATDAEAIDPAAWARHTWQTVRFADGLGALMQQEGRVFLEVGPGQGLVSFVLQHPAAARLKDKLVLASLHNRYERQPDEQYFLASAGQLWLAGMECVAPPRHVCNAAA